MQQELSHNEIHPLHIIDLTLVIRECNQDSPQFFVAATTLRLRKIVVLSECTAQITLNLRDRVLIWLHIDQAFVGLLHLLVLFRRIILQRLGARVDLLVPLARFLAEH